MADQEQRHQKQAATHDAYRVAVNQRRMLVLPEEFLSGSEHRTSGWFLDTNIRLVFDSKNIGGPQKRGAYTAILMVS